MGISELTALELGKEIKEKQIHQKSPKNKIFSQIFAIMLSVLLMRKGNGEDTFSVKQRLQSG